jgi:dipeptidyl aminopeptidase/acylaminoacyl peptidase
MDLCPPVAILLRQIPTYTRVRKTATTSLRPFPERLLVTEYVPPDGSFSATHSVRIGISSDPKRPDSHLVVINTTTTAVRPLDLDPQALNDYALWYFAEGVIWWSADYRYLFLITETRGASRAALTSIDLDNGRTREILNETATFNVRLNPYDYDVPNVFVSSKGDEAIWYSERSGYGHLYLYDVSTGKVKRQLTSGDWVVFDLLNVDEKRRVAYFTAGPRSGGRNPYYRYLYRVGLDRGDIKQLTPEPADHRFEHSLWYPAHGSSMSPSGKYFVDSISSTDQPARVVLRKASGELVGEVTRTDASALFASGWRAPDRVSVKAADGVTDLYGVVYKPHDFDPTKKYPVIDYMYPGPQGAFVPIAFRQVFTGGLGTTPNAQAFADAGFIVVVVDGRGTAYRSRSFRDAFLGTEDVFGAADHVAAIKGLGAQRSYMDLDRVGVMGHSFGGFGSLRAMLLFPNFFKVGVSSVGPGQWLDFHQEDSIERFFGVPGASPEARAHYDLVSNTRLVSRLKGRVLLIFGGIDENVPLKYAFQVIDALIRADRDFDMLIAPDSPHSVGREPYPVKRSLEYFIDHLAAPTEP